MIRPIQRTGSGHPVGLPLANGRTEFGVPKTKAGTRTAPVPRDVLPSIVDHLADHVGAHPDALLFTASNGAPLRRTKFRYRWIRACEKAKVTELHFHDLRHTGLTLYAQQGATLAELQGIAGHKSVAAVMRYQHSTLERHSALAEAVSTAITAAKVVNE